MDYPVDGLDLKKAKDLVKTLFNELGESASKKLFAETIQMTASGGSFRGKLSSLMKFGLIKYDENDNILLTDLGKKIVNAYTTEIEKKFLFKAFINVPEFRAIIEKFKDRHLNLKILDKILILEYNVEKKHVIRVKKSIINSLDYIGVLNKETGDLDLTSVIDIPKENIKDLKDEVETVVLKEKEQRVFNLKHESIKSLINLNSELFDLFITFASHLSPMDISIDDVRDIIQRNPNFTHTKLAIEFLKDVIEEGNQISQDKLEKLIEALKLDLNI